MQAKQRILVYGLMIFVVAPLIIWLIAYSSILFSSNILEHPLARIPLFPVLCSSRGCVTTATWVTNHTIQVAFAEATETDAPSLLNSLTTVARQHLVTHASLRVPVTTGDARRYRTDILQATDESLTLETLGLSLADYDQIVILPLLQQEALRQERLAESLDDLFRLLAQERYIGIPPLTLQWDSSAAQVVGS